MVVGIVQASVNDAVQLLLGRRILANVSKVRKHLVVNYHVGGKKKIPRVEPVYLLSRRDCGYPSQGIGNYWPISAESWITRRVA